MNCRDALEALTIGPPLSRWRAARHRARCPRCSERAEALRAIVDALMDVPPLTPADRQAWMQAADPEIASPPRPRPRLAIAATLLGLSFAAVAAWRATRPDGPSPGPIVRSIEPALVKRAALSDLDALKADADRLSRDLDTLLREVDLLDARKDVESLQVQLASLGGRGGS